MMTNTTYDPRLLEQWAIDPSSTQDIGRLLETYLHQYDCAFFSKNREAISQLLLRDYSVL